MKELGEPEGLLTTGHGQAQNRGMSTVPIRWLLLVVVFTTRGPSCTMDCGSSKIEEGLQAHCKNQPSVHGQLAGISKLNPRRLGTRFYKSEVRSDLASAERAGSAGKHCSSRARGNRQTRVSSAPPTIEAARRVPVKHRKIDPLPWPVGNFRRRPSHRDPSG